MLHLCQSCKQDFATCSARKIVFGINRDPSLRGASADAVIECDMYKPLRVQELDSRWESEYMKSRRRKRL